MRRIFLVLAITFFSMFCVSPSRAFSISPSKILLTLNPGDQKTISVSVTNSDSEDLYFVGEIFAIEQSNDGQPIFFQNKVKAENWVVPQDRELIKKNETKIFQFTLNIPKNTYPGSYFLGLGIKPDQQQNGVGLTGQIISLLNLQISGQAQEELVVGKWQLNKNKSNLDNYVFDLSLDNKSNVDVDLTGTVRLYNWHDELMYSQIEYLGNTMIPNSARFLSPKVKRNKFSFSPITKAKIDINYGRLNLQASSQTLIFNWSVILTYFVFIMVAIFITISYLRRSINKRKNILKS